MRLQNILELFVATFVIQIEELNTKSQQVNLLRWSIKIHKRFSLLCLLFCHMHRHTHTHTEFVNVRTIAA